MTRSSACPFPTSHNGTPTGRWEAFCKTKIVSPRDIAALASQLHQEGKTIATLNGAFDVLHPGHLFMLYEASLTADLLIVALNTDASIAHNKGPSRPIFPLKRRLEMLVPFVFIDFLTSFDEPTPCALLKKIKPNIHVNGEEYGPHCLEKGVVEKMGGKIHLVPRLADLSTTNLLKKIQNQCD